MYLSFTDSSFPVTVLLPLSTTRELPTRPTAAVPPWEPKSYAGECVSLLNNSVWDNFPTIKYNWLTWHGNLYKWFETATHHRSASVWVYQVKEPRKLIREAAAAERRQTTVEFGGRHMRWYNRVSIANGRTGQTCNKNGAPSSVWEPWVLLLVYQSSPPL